MLPIMMEVADQNPIFLARDEVVGIMDKEDKEKEIMPGNVTKVP